MCVCMCEREREKEREIERESVCVKLYLLNVYDTFRTNYAVIT